MQIPETRRQFDPSEDELRRVLDARELEKELERKKMSRKISRFFAISALILLTLILCFPATRITFTGLNPSAPKATTVNSPPIPSKNPADSAIPEELKPFSIRPGEQSNHESLRFGMELLQFMQPSAPISKPPASSISGDSRKIF